MKYTPATTAVKTLPRQRSRTPLPPRSKTPTQVSLDHQTSSEAGVEMTPPISMPCKMLSERTQKLVRKLKHEGGVGGGDQVVSSRTPRIPGDGLTMSDEVKLVFDKYTKLPTAASAASPLINNSTVEKTSPEKL
eukprot:sb/3474829/